MATSSTRLTPHFTLGEFAEKDGTLPPAQSVQSLTRLCREVLEPMRARFGVCTIVSGCRSVVHNKAVGGSGDSRHLYSKHLDSPAVDVVFARQGPEQWAALAISMRVGGVGLYPGHVHLDQRRTRVRW